MGSILHRARYGTGASTDGTPGSIRYSPGGAVLARYGPVWHRQGSGLGTSTGHKARYRSERHRPGGVCGAGELPSQGTGGKKSPSPVLCITVPLLPGCHTSASTGAASAAAASPLRPPLPARPFPRLPPRPRRPQWGRSTAPTFPGAALQAGGKLKG
ncbi:hypothetical protein Nmel_017692 [Mimus melanotis]